jgi:hypothetical protein
MSELKEASCPCGCVQPCVHDVDDRLHALEESMINGHPSHWPMLTQDLVLIVARYIKQHGVPNPAGSQTNPHPPE